MRPRLKMASVLIGTIGLLVPVAGAASGVATAEGRRVSALGRGALSLPGCPNAANRKPTSSPDRWSGQSMSARECRPRTGIACGLK